MSWLKSYGLYFLLVMVIALSATVMSLRSENARLTSDLDFANAKIRMIQQSQKMADDASKKFQERKEVLRNEQERQEKIASDALDNHKDWADSYLPDSVLRLFGNKTTDTDPLHSTSGAAQ